MGLSASQARLLNMTARMHDIEYKAQNLEAQKLQMANESRHVYQEYEDALDKQKIQLKHIGTDGAIVYKNVTGTDLADAEYYYQVTTNAKGKKGVLFSGSNLTAALSAAGAETLTGTTPDFSTQLQNALGSGLIVLVKIPNTVTVTSGTTKYDDIKDKDGVYETNVATDTNLQEVSDEVDLKKAEAKYEADMRKINSKDKKFDTDLAALESERTAIKTEMDTLKNVAKENVDRTFKLFS